MKTVARKAHLQEAVQRIEQRLRINARDYLIEQGEKRWAAAVLVREFDLRTLLDAVKEAKP